MNGIHKLNLLHREETEEKDDKSRDEALKILEPSSCLDLATGGRGHSCDGRSCVRIQSFRDLAKCCGDITEKEKSEVQIIADCYASTTVSLATALGFFSMIIVA